MCVAVEIDSDRFSPRMFVIITFFRRFFFLLIERNVSIVQLQLQSNWFVFFVSPSSNFLCEQQRKSHTLLSPCGWPSCGSSSIDFVYNVIDHSIGVYGARKRIERNWCQFSFVWMAFPLQYVVSDGNNVKKLSNQRMNSVA